MPKFRKKPVIIDAFQLGLDPMPDWFEDAVSANEITTHRIVKETQHLYPFEHSETYCMIKTLEGEMKGDYGDYIIQGVQGEIYPVKENIFLKTYERVE